jgi:hypothetical protein
MGFSGFFTEELQLKGNNWISLIYSVLASDIKITTRKYSSCLFIEDLYYYWIILLCFQEITKVRKFQKFLKI